MVPANHDYNGIAFYLLGGKKGVVDLAFYKSKIRRAHSHQLRDAFAVGDLHMERDTGKFL